MEGTLYPDKLPAAKMLAFYATKFPTVEINNTFYRMPAPEMLGKWSAETPDSFRFAIKSPKRITHEKKLAGAAEEIARLYQAAATLGPKLGPVLFQLPPFFRKDTDKLSEFVKSLPPGARAAFEFRHESWFVPEVFELLRSHDAALCIAEADDFATPMEATASWGYLRLRRQDYDEGQLAAWAQRIGAQSWQYAYVFLKHEDEGKGPALANRLIELLAAPPTASAS